jgi:porphobilinogen synthase
MAFPVTRLRRLRARPALRAWVRETKLTSAGFVQPYFVRPGKNERRPVASMPGVFQLSMDELVKDARQAAKLGVPAVMLFGVPNAKDPFGREASSDDGIVQAAVRALKNALPELVVLTDLCLCEYTDHGHCGVLLPSKNGAAVVDNDATLGILSEAALAQARAGSDGVAPSGMMDGVVKTVRGALDGEGFRDTFIMAYSTKFSSAYYGPFRDAAKSAPRFGDRKSYQMDPANRREAVRESKTDAAEGADILMVKPALAYLDVIRDVREATSLPLAAYNVSGEYAMVKAAAAKGWIDEKAVVLETLLSIKRAGADILITYHAKDAARWLNG